MKTTFIYVGKVQTWLKLLLKGYIPESKYLVRYIVFILTAIITIPFKLYEKFRYGNRLNQHKISSDPIFIIGHMRSGTTHLHNILGCDTNLGYPKSFDAFAPEFFLSSRFLIPLLQKIAPKKREMDNMKVEASLPQEEEFSIFALSEYSFFFHMFFPKNAQHFFKKYNLFNNSSDFERIQWKKVYMQLLKKFSFACNGKQLVVKNPVNTGRVNMLLQMYPNAKFIVISRSPYEVYLSTRHLYRKLLPICQLQSISDEFIDKMILEFYSQQMKKMITDIKSIPSRNLVSLKFEELLEKPVDELKKIYEKLDISDFNKQKENFEGYLKKIKGYKKNDYEMCASDIEKVNRNWKFAFEQLDYTMITPVQ